jgi:hypothetical protein
MKEKDLNFNKQLFDQQIVEQLGEIPPPEDEISNINPWEKPIGFITWGFILTTFHLNNLKLQYILPSIGVILIYLGFRSLRKENKYFKTAWILAIVKMVWHLANFVWISTPLNTIEYPEIAIGMIANGFQIVMYLVFHMALKVTYKKADKKAEAAPLLWASLWTAAVVLIALSPMSQNWLVFIPMVICYILIVRSLYRTGTQLGDAGYVLKNASVKISNQLLGWIYILIALVTVVSCSVFSNHLKLAPQEYHVPETNQARQQLLDMGFPADALQYLNDEVVALLRGAVDVEVYNKLLMIDPRKIEHKESYGSHTWITHTYEPGRKNIDSTTIYIEMPENLVYVMQYFKWKEGNPVWQDGIMISGESKADDKKIISSGLFYKRKGNEYVADFPRLVCDKVVRNTMFGVDYSMLITGALSYPFGSESQGGYVLYSYTIPIESNVYATLSMLSYVHLSSPIHIPYAKTEEQILNGAYIFEDMLQQHYTNYESAAGRAKNTN